MGLVSAKASSLICEEKKARIRLTLLLACYRKTQVRRDGTGLLTTSGPNKTVLKNTFFLLKQNEPKTK